MCREGTDWDDEVPEALRARWEGWRGELNVLANLKIPRCCKPDDFKEVESVEPHHFFDASKDGYGHCSYLRLADTDKKGHCSLVMAVTCCAFNASDNTKA